MNQEILTVSQLLQSVRLDIWPSGEAENLISAHNNHFQEAMIDICRWVETEKENNTNVVAFCKTYYKNGMTVIKGVRGVVKRIYTIANANWRDPVEYVQRPWPEPEWEADKYLTTIAPSTTPLPLGFYPASADTDRAGDVDNPRARRGIWSVHEGNIYISPWINSNEVVVVEWSGNKLQWDDGDLVNPEITFRKAVMLYMRYAHERDYGSMEKASVYLVRRPGMSDTGLYADALADLMYDSRERTRFRETTQAPAKRSRTSDELSDDVAPTT